MKRKSLFTLLALIALEVSTVLIVSGCSDDAIVLRPSDSLIFTVTGISLLVVVMLVAQGS
jgi:hypothetical protein